ncbi:hypothetical protein PIB19_19345 [Sphingomonas sp. 7/4-4]|nr:hypothetical protein [Sphingomonas sp. 7/4-4]WBY07473.1 hypothetical protein PIB19_19345 [Sphingomonas sp. 7/4-4]
MIRHRPPAARHAPFRLPHGERDLAERSGGFRDRCDRRDRVEITPVFAGGVEKHRQRDFRMSQGLGERRILPGGASRFGEQHVIGNCRGRRTGKRVDCAGVGRAWPWPLAECREARIVDRDDENSLEAGGARNSTTRS